MYNAVPALVCVCPVAFAVIQYVRTYKAINMLRELAGLFEQISCILNSCALELRPLFAALILRQVSPVFCKQVKQCLEDGDSFLQAWQKSLHGHADSFLSAKETEELISFAKHFGYGSLQEQQKLCSRYTELCITLAEERKMSIEKNGRLCLSGSVLFGIFLYIVLM